MQGLKSKKNARRPLNVCLYVVSTVDGQEQDFVSPPLKLKNETQAGLLMKTAKKKKIKFNSTHFGL